MDEAVELLWQRDVARAKLRPLEAENARLRVLLKYAEEAVMAEYSLRVYGDEHSYAASSQEEKK